MPCWSERGLVSDDCSIVFVTVSVSVNLTFSIFGHISLITFPDKERLQVISIGVNISLIATCSYFICSLFKTPDIVR